MAALMTMSSAASDHHLSTARSRNHSQRLKPASDSQPVPVSNGRSTTIGSHAQNGCTTILVRPPMRSITRVSLGTSCAPGLVTNSDHGPLLSALRLLHDIGGGVSALILSTSRGRNGREAARNG